MLLQQLINGLTIGSTYALVAIGFTMVFGVLEVANFSNGSLYMLGAYLSMIFLKVFHNDLLLAFTLSIILTGIVGYCVDRFALKSLRRKKAPHISALITTLGAAMIIDNLIMILFGTETKPFKNFLDFGSINIGNADLRWDQIIIMSSAFFLMGILWIVVYKTKLGTAMRSTAQNPEAAKLMGVNINTVTAFTWIVSGLLASISGTMVAMYYNSVDINMGAQNGIATFAAAVLGGVGDLPGAVVGGLCMGVLETIAAAYISSGYRNAIAFSILIIMLLLKPEGLFGQKSNIKV